MKQVRVESSLVGEDLSITAECPRETSRLQRSVGVWSVVVPAELVNVTCFEDDLDNVSSLDQKHDQVVGQRGTVKSDELICLRRV